MNRSESPRIRVLVTGASGLLGRSLMRILAERPDIEALGTAFSRVAPPLVRLDLADEASLGRLMDEFRPDAVIHAAAERRPDMVDRDPARAAALNVGGTAAVARAAAAQGALLVYISTDYVFDGVNPPYFPDSPVRPLNAYGEMKLEGERVARREVETARAARLAILRIPLLYGPVQTLAECSVTEIAAKITSGAPCSIEHWATRWPIHVDDVSRALVAILDAGCVAGTGAPASVYQLSGPVGYTKYGMALVMAKAMGLNPAFISPDPSKPAGAPRPKDCRMDTSALTALGWAARIGFEEGIAEVLGARAAAGSACQPA